MTSKQSTIELQSVFQGALLGLAVGDALAFPYKKRKRSFLKSVTRLSEKGFSRHEKGFFPNGQFTDDTQTAIATVLATTESGEVDPQVVVEHLIPLWRDQQIVDSSAVAGEVLDALAHGRAGPDSSGLPAGHLEGFGLATAVPVGLWFCDDAGTLVSQGGAVASITHQDQRVCAAAVGMSAAVSYAVEASDILLGALLDRVADASSQFDGELARCVLDFPRILSMTEYRALQELEKYVSKQTGEALNAFDGGVPDNALFLFLAALYYFLRSPFNFERVLTSSLHAGGEVTTLCALSGALSGAFLGVSVIPEIFREGVLDGERLIETIDDFHAAWSAKE